MFPYKLNEAAHREYIEAYQWYELTQVGLGKRFMFAVEGKLVQIANHPKFYSVIGKHHRQAKVEGFPFVIVFEFFEKNSFIHIAAILHVKRNPKKKYRKFLE